MRKTLLFLLFIFFSLEGMAYDVTPTHLDMEFGKEYTVKVTNNSNKVIPLEASIFERLVSKDDEKLLANEDIIEIFPPQILLQEGKSKEIRLRLKQDPPNKNKKYYLTFSQLPISGDAVNDSEVKFLVNISISINLK